ncbi:hypothetical protein IA539_09065 [Gordonia sp. zg691]|uniref:hypothetical protein n=1 Tax=Gordonia jinghuaiqii TaxID=2758710 RepID=UPI0016627860|nr:hypothetical protein [Gordonia jinghuaiqii]MBD0861363.1 hypothetical protein [Gordonia jinghuaiqii]
MLVAVVFVPSAPLLVPELAGPAASDTDAVRAATLDTVGRAASDGIDRWVAVGTADAAADRVAGGRVCEPAAGSFARFGVDVGVSLAGERPRGAAGRMSLSMLIAAWLDERLSMGPMSAFSVGAATPPAECAALGSALGAELDAAGERIGVLVVGDGATALTDKAPGGGRRDSAVALNDTIVAAIGAADTDALAALDPCACDAEGVGGRVAWQVAAAIAGHRAVTASTIYSAAPFGVGYVVATWIPAPTRVAVSGEGDR